MLERELGRKKTSTPLCPRQLGRAEPRGRAARGQSGVPNNTFRQQAFGRPTLPKKSRSIKPLELQRGTRKDLWPKYFPECPVARHFVCPEEKQFGCHS